MKKNKTVCLKQERLPNGRFGKIVQPDTFAFTERRHFIKEDSTYTREQVLELIKKAFLAGHNEQGGMALPSKKAQNYINKLEL